MLIHVTKVCTTILLTLVALIIFGGAALADTTINGAGATFPYPVYAQWAYLYNKETGIKLNYQSIGSGGGIKQITAKTVDFGASDAPLKADKLDEEGLLQFPMIMGGVVPVVNLPGIEPGGIKLTAATLSGIFLGEITKWNDPKIAADNKGVALPDTAVTVVHRADGSGTTWIFTNYLSKVASAWNEKVGNAKSVKWPAGVGGKGNEGVAAYVQRIKGAIGYVEYAYALQNKLTYALLQNRDGGFVAPTSESFQAAAANAEWAKAKGFYLVLTDQPGKTSWPITGASFILVHKDQANAQTIKAVLDFFDWCYANGGPTAEKLHYVPMPKPVVDLVQKKWKTEIKSGGKPVWK
jgi:phosphate transport system substrate-binding protein